MKVAIALITAKRPQSLARLLASLDQLETSAEVSLIIVDNDPQQSAQPVITTYAQTGRFKLTALAEPTPGIPLARNAALRACGADIDALAFIDDDEMVTPGWLEALLHTLNTTKADAAGGPVLPLYPADTPAWVIAGGFFERAKHQDASLRHVLATNNCLINMSCWRRAPIWFDPRLQFTGSSDTLFFLTARQRGWQLRWSATAEVHEHVPPARLTPAWIIQRQYRMGNGLALCDILAYGYARSLLPRLAKAAVYTTLALAGLWQGQAGRIKARARWARARGTLAALYGYRYEEYAPHRLIGEAP